MTDRIDTDATRGNVEQLRGCADADLGSHDVRWCLSVMDRLCDEVDRLRADLRSEQMERADAEADAQLLRERLGDERERRRAEEGEPSTREGVAARGTGTAPVTLPSPAPVGLTERQWDVARQALLDHMAQGGVDDLLGAIDQRFSVPVSPSVDPEEEP